MMKVHICVWLKILPVLFFCIFLHGKLQACNTPAPAVLGAKSVCINSVQTYSSFYTGYSSYKWEVINGTITKGNGTADIEIAWTTVGKGSLKLLVTDNTGCKDSVITTIVVNPPLTYKDVNAGPDFNVCFNDSIILGPADSFNGFRFEWMDTRYAHLGTIQFKEKNPIFFVKTNNQKFVIKYKVKITDSATGCFIYDSVIVTIHPSYKTKITGYTGCFKDTALYSTDTLPTGAVWRAENGTILSSNQTKNILVKWHKGGTNNLILSYKTGICNDSTVFQVRLDSLKEPEISGDMLICSNYTNYYTLAVQNNETITWNFSNAKEVKDLGNNAKLITWDSAKTEGGIKVKITTDLGCSISKDFKIVFGKPASAAFITDNTVCRNDTSWYLPEDTSHSDYQWFFGDGATSAAKFPKHIYTKAGLYQTRLVVQNSTGCRDTFTTTINVKARSQKADSIIGDNKVVAHDIETYLVEPMGGGTYVWRVNGGEILSGDLSNRITVQWGDSILNAVVKLVWLVNGFCPSDTTFLPVQMLGSPNSVSEFQPNAAFKIFPNPFHSAITIETNDNIPAYQITLTDLLGKQHFAICNPIFSDGKSTINIQTENLRAGIYFILIHDGKNTYRQKVIKL